MFRPHTFNINIIVVEFNSQVSSTPLLVFPCGSSGKESVSNAGEMGSIPGQGTKIPQIAAPEKNFKQLKKKKCTI